jgi:hypothetical protein
MKLIWHAKRLEYDFENEIGTGLEGDGSGLFQGQSPEIK